MSSKLKIIKNALLYLIILLSIKPTYLLQKTLSGDDLSYWIFITSFLLDYDWKFYDEIVLQSIEIDTVYKTLVPLHSYGSSLISIPFISIFLIFDQILNQDVLTLPNKVFNSSMYFGYYFLSSFVIFYGIKLINKSLDLLEIDYKKIDLAIIVLGSGIYYYTFNRFTLNHTFEFFVNCLIIYTFTKIAKDKKTFYIPFFIFFLFLSLNIRIMNFNILFFPLVIFFLMKKDFKVFSVNYFLEKKNLIIMSFLAFLSFFSFLNYKLYGVIYRTSYCFNEFSCESGHPYLGQNIYEVYDNFLISLKNINGFLFGFGTGLFFSFPIIFLIIIYLFKNAVELKLKIFILGSLSVPLITTFFWRGRELEFNQRFLIGIVPICIIIYFYLINKKIINSKFHRILLVVSIYSIFNQSFYHVNEYVSLSEGISYMGEVLKFTNPDINFDIIVQFLGNVFFIPTFVFKSLVGINITFFSNILNIDLINLIGINQKVIDYFILYGQISNWNIIMINLYVFFLYRFIKKNIMI